MAQLNDDGNNKFLSKNIADSLCTTIAMGFMVLNLEPGTNTIFGYDPADEANHMDLMGRLNRIGVNVSFRALPAKDRQPLIIAKTSKVSVPETFESIADPFRKSTGAAESEINSQVPTPRGAYIGGLATLEKLKISGPSQVYFIGKSKYREITTDESQEINKAYQNAAQATNSLIDFIKGCRHSSIELDSSFAEEEKAASDPPKSPQIFASVHGMIKALATFSVNSNGSDVCFEWALGRDTDKVASCLPCSIFMRAAGVPATYTHLSYGDNWNLPLKGTPTFRDFYNNLWRELIKQCFADGWSIAQEQRNFHIFGDMWTMARALGTTPEMLCNCEELPDIFLEALTFQGKFIDKMKYALKEVSQ